MNANVRVEVEGFQELRAKIMQLANDKTKRKEVLAVLRQMAKPTLKAANYFAPISNKPHKLKGGAVVQSGNLRRSLGLVAGRKEDPTIYVMARTKGKNPGWYSPMVLRGHDVYKKGTKRNRKKSGGMQNRMNSKGRTDPQPFLDNAYSQTDAFVTAATDKALTIYIQKKIDKLGR